ncbi:hypothetical protein [Bradyrhizobium sp. CCGUVB1N3]|nr:hypothetical protein [Bradyrhizobium sp. CCGUVB1N3]
MHRLRPSFFQLPDFIFLPTCTVGLMAGRDTPEVVVLLHPTQRVV